jgi:hypothetical protein
MNGNDLERCRRLLESLKAQTPSRSRRLTLLELGGYPHLEDVASNILEFYLSPEEEHGFDRIVLDSLLSLADIDEDFEIEEISLVTREQRTLRKKRLDLVVESETTVVGIENKIGQPVYNDLPEYMRFLKGISGAAKTPVGILLALQDRDPKVQLEGFNWVTYDSFFQGVFQRIPIQLSSIDTQYLTDFVVFAKTILALKGGNQMVSDETFKLVQEYENEFKKLFGIATEVRAEMKRKVKELVEEAEEDLASLQYRIKEEKSPKNPLRCYLQIKFGNRIPGQDFTLDVAVYPSGWRLEFWPVPWSSVENAVQLASWLGERGIPNAPNPDFRSSRISQDQLAYNANIADEVAPWLHKFMEKVTGA